MCGGFTDCIQFGVVVAKKSLAVMLALDGGSFRAMMASMDLQNGLG